MKYVDEFRDGELAKTIAARVASAADTGRTYHFMEFCGGHTHAISRYGVKDLLPSNVVMVHGPGCPVCVLPIGRIDMAIDLAMGTLTPDPHPQPFSQGRREHFSPLSLGRGAGGEGPSNITLCTYADTMRVPASNGMSLMKAKAQGADIRMVYSAADVLRIAREEPERQVVFFAIGFETTTPPTALVVKQAALLKLENFSVFVNHVLTPSAIAHILESPEVRDLGTVVIDGFVGPAHVSTIIGSQPYEYFAEEYRKPVVIAGFEPLDVMQAIEMLVKQVNEGRAEVENEFSRAVTREGNAKAKALVAELFELRREFEWRGLGLVPYSALRLKDEWAAFDAERRFGLKGRSVPDNKACECGAILRGVKKPTDCKVFGTACTPETPIGSCMVSSEGACAAHYTYGRYRTAA